MTGAHRDVESALPPRAEPESAPPAVDVSRLATVWSGRTRGLPRAVTPLIGREREREVLRELLRPGGPRLVTLTGPGGVGKTRLAIEVARELVGEFADGVLFVPLAAVDAPDLVIPAIAAALELREMGAAPIVEILCTALRGRHLLLVLDNLEHLLPAAVALGELLDACPGITMMITSRAPLRLHDEQRFPVSPLSLPDDAAALTPEAAAASDAVSLFVSRATQVQPDFALQTENVDAVVEICRKLDGLPLAIELAAPWLRLLSPATLSAHLERRLPLLTGGSADQPARLRSMHDAIAWSHDLLDADEKRLFRRLGIFRAGFTLDAAEWISAAAPEAASDADILSLLAALVDAHLVARADHDAPEPRFTMLETVYEFALEQLAAAAEIDAVAEAHARYMADLVSQAEPHMFGPHERTWFARFHAELPNLRTAMNWGLSHDVGVTLWIAGVLWTWWATTGPLSEGRRWLTAALAIDWPVPPAIRARGLTTAAALAALQGHFETTSALVPTALALAREAGDRMAEGRAMFPTIAVRWTLESDRDLSSEFDAALALLAGAMTTHDHGWAAYILGLRGASESTTGRWEAADQSFAAALDRAHVADSDVIRLMVNVFLSGTRFKQGRLQEARASSLEAVRLGIKHGETWHIGFSLSVLATIDAAEGLVEDAARRLGAGEALMAQAGIFLPPTYETQRAEAETRAEAKIGRAAFTTLWRAGAADPGVVIAGALAADPLPRQQSSPMPPANLSAREQEVLRLLVAGSSDKAIAEKLAISRKTASNHVANILRKLGVETRTSAAAKAVRDELV